jgi:hypothetical protein
MPPNDPPNIGTDDIRAWSGGMLAAFSAEFSLDIDEVELAGDDWAFERGTYTIALTPNPSGTPIRDTGTYLTIYRRLTDHSWLMARDIWNSNNPLPGQAYTRAPRIPDPARTLRNRSANSAGLPPNGEPSPSRPRRVPRPHQSRSVTLGWARTWISPIAGPRGRMHASQSERSSKRRARDKCKRPVEGRSVDLAAQAALVA